jgi:CMP-N-acetylneuraminic acid synthetase
MNQNSKKPEVLAIIPARGGSKGIPRKNIKNLCGKPLIAYSIEAALKSKTIDRVVVSTEDEEIAEVSKSFGADVPFMRPKDLAQDRSNLGDAIDFTIKKMQLHQYCPEIIVTLYPTHPFRTPALINSLVGKLIEGYSPVRTVKAVKHTKLSIFSSDKGNKLTPLLKFSNQNEKINSKTYFRLYGLFIGVSGNSWPYLHLIKNPISLIDIDTMEDFCVAEEIIRRRLFDFNSEEIIDSDHPYIY